MVPTQMPKMEDSETAEEVIPRNPDIWQATERISAHSIRDGFIKVDLDSEVEFDSSTNVGPCENLLYICTGCCSKNVSFNTEVYPSGSTNLDGFKVTDMALCCSDNRKIIDLSDNELLGTLSFKYCSEEAEVKKDGTLLYKVNDARASSRSTRWCYEFPCICVCALR